MEKKNYDLQAYPLQQETDLIIKTALEIHKVLGAGFLEIVYKDAFEYEYRRKLFYIKEKKNIRLFIKTLSFPIDFLLIL